MKKGSIFNKIEDDIVLYQHGWDDPTVGDFQAALIQKANNLVSIVDYFETKYNIEVTHSNNGWTHRMICPFHNWGQEKIPSCFLNSAQNRYYCQACSASGSLVDYISHEFGRPPACVAEHIINCVEGKVSVQEDGSKKLLNKKIFEENLIKISTMYREFVHKYKDCEQALEYANKCMAGFDNVWEANPKQVEESIKQLVEKFELYFSKY